MLPDLLHARSRPGRRGGILERDERCRRYEIGRAAGRGWRGGNDGGHFGRGAQEAVLVVRDDTGILGEDAGAGAGNRVFVGFGGSTGAVVEDLYIVTLQTLS
jgi:hypothetical protein